MWIQSTVQGFVQNLLPESQRTWRDLNQNSSALFLLPSVLFLHLYRSWCKILSSRQDIRSHKTPIMYVHNQFVIIHSPAYSSPELCITVATLPSLHLPSLLLHQHVLFIYQHVSLICIHVHRCCVSLGLLAEEFLNGWDSLCQAFLRFGCIT